MPFSLTKNHEPAAITAFHGFYAFIYGQDVSRVLYLTIIYLGLLLPASSCDLPIGQRRAAAFCALFWSCSGWGLHDRYVTIPACELLPHNFNLTTALPVSAVCFCCTFPIVTYAGRYPASSPWGARTFLMYSESTRDRLSYPKIIVTLTFIPYIFYFVKKGFYNVFLPLQSLKRIQAYRRFSDFHRFRKLLFKHSFHGC